LSPRPHVTALSAAPLSSTSAAASPARRRAAAACPSQSAAAAQRSSSLPGRDLIGSALLVAPKDLRIGHIWVRTPCQRILQGIDRAISLQHRDKHVDIGVVNATRLDLSKFLQHIVRRSIAHLLGPFISGALVNGVENSIGATKEGRRRTEI